MFISNIPRGNHIRLYCSGCKSVRLVDPESRDIEGLTFVEEVAALPCPVCESTLSQNVLWQLEPLPTDTGIFNRPFGDRLPDRQAASNDRPRGAVE